MNIIPKHLLPILSLILILTAAGCKSSGGSSATTDTTGGAGGGTSALTAAQVAGSHTAPCLATGTGNTYGTGMNNLGFYRSINLTAGGTFSMSVLLFTSAICLGGSEIFALTISGTYTLGSLLTSGATGILYVQNSANMTVYGGASGGGSISFGDGWVTTFNSNCPGGPATFTLNSASTRSMASVTCNTGGLALPTINANGTNFYDAISTASGFAVSPANNIFMMGQYSSYPATATYNYTN